MKRVVLLSSLTLAACGGGSSFSEGEPSANPPTGIVSVQITDAPVDDVQEVWVQFTSVTLKPQDGDAIVVDLGGPQDVELLALQNGVTETLVPPTTVPAGNYSWIRLAVNAEFDSVFDSYAVQDGNQVEIRIPSGGTSGLQVNGSLVVSQNQSVSFVLDWDLRQSLTDPVGQPGYILRPVIRVSDTSSTGNLAGTVDDTLLNDDLNGEATCNNDLNEDTGNAVYLYNGRVQSPDDIQDSDVSPFATASVKFDGNAYGYSLNFIDSGEYTAAFTCQGLGDDPETDDDIEFASVVPGIVISEGETTQQDFPPPQ